MPLNTPSIIPQKRAREESCDSEYSRTEQASSSRDLCNQAITQQTLRVIAGPFAKRCPSHTTPKLDKYHIRTIEKALTDTDLDDKHTCYILVELITNFNLPIENINRIFDLAINTAPKPDKYNNWKILIALARSGKIDDDQYLRILSLATNPSSELNHNWQNTFLEAITRRRGITPEQINRILDFAINPDSNLEDGSRLVILLDLFTNGNLHDKQLYKIFNLSINDNPNINEEFKINLLDRITKDNNLTNEQFDKIIKLYENLVHKLTDTDPQIYYENKWEILSMLAKNRRLNDKQFDSIIDFFSNVYPELNEDGERGEALVDLTENRKLTSTQIHKAFNFTMKLDLYDYYKIDVLLSLASSEKLNDDQYMEIIEFTIDPNTDIDESDERHSSLKELATNNNLSKKLIDKIIELIINLNPDINLSEMVWLLLPLISSKKINTAQYLQIFEFATNLKTELDLKIIILEALYTNNQFDPRTLEKLQTKSIIKHPLLHLNRIYHLISDKKTKTDEKEEILLRDLDEMRSAISTRSFINYLSNIETLTMTHDTNLNTLLENTQDIVASIDECIYAESTDMALKHAIENLEKLVENLEPGEGIPIQLGTGGHAIVYEINRYRNGLYSFAIINTGLGAEYSEQSGRMICRKYLDLTLAQVHDAIKEAINLRLEAEKYSHIEFTTINARTNHEKRSIISFNKTIETMFQEKTNEEQVISPQKRNTCSWSSLDCWFKRYCKEKKMPEVYDEFNRLTAKDALKTAHKIIANAEPEPVIVGDYTPSFSDLEMQAIIIARTAAKALQNDSCRIPF